MNLATLLTDYCANASDYAHLTVTGLALSSAQVRDGYVFIALAGAKQHGLHYIDQAMAGGACAVLYDAAALPCLPSSAIPLIAIANLSQQLGALAARFYDNPSQALTVIGITGTNGKTSCSQFLAQTLQACGVIGTLGWGRHEALLPTLNTTPDALALQTMLASLQKQGMTRVAMEVSSHGLHQGRVNGVQFTGAVVTNISRDHLDYHLTMNAYVQAKTLLLKMPQLGFAVINLDDSYSEQLLNALPAKVALWGVSRHARHAPRGETLIASNSSHDEAGLAFTVHWRGAWQRLHCPLYGDFNIDNVLTVLAVLLALGMNLTQATDKLSHLKPVQGRMERFGGQGKPLVFVDYAHTPDALEKVLTSVRPHCKGQLWLVFGCGGNRDTGKRPLMGAVAQRLADRVIITDDNPRDENSAAIMQAIMQGCVQAEPLELIADRAHAINAAVRRAHPLDCIIIAGKGHENYQESAGMQTPFSDKEQVLAALALR